MKAATVTCGIYLYSKRIGKIVACHATHAPWNNWSIPKGIPDEGEDAYTAALRELYEETGIELHKIHVIAVHDLTAVTYQKQNKILESFLVVTDSDLSRHSFVCHSLTEREFPEVDKWKWVSLDEAEIVLHEAQQKNIVRIKKLLSNL